MDELRGLESRKARLVKDVEYYENLSKNAKEEMRDEEKTLQHRKYLKNCRYKIRALKKEIEELNVVIEELQKRTVIKKPKVFGLNGWV